MHVGVDLGFGSLVVAVVAVVVGLVIRGKWRRSVARKAEIKRLLVLASEEAARAELEATLSYYGSLDDSSYSSSESSSSSSRNGYQCAVCFCPTTTRCARCKAVRYCSGKCQIIHWRKGHKEECRHFSEDFLNHGYGGNHGPKVLLQEEQEVSDKRYENASVDTTSVQPNSSSSAEVPNMKNESNTDDYSADDESTYTASEFSGGSFSGFSTSPLHSGSSDDVSVGESAASNETEASDGHMLPDTGPDMLEHRFNNMGNSHPSSPKFACLVDYLDSDNEQSISNHRKYHSTGGSKSKHSVSGSLHQSTSPGSENSATKHNDNSSGFWGRTLDSVMNRLESVDGSASSCTNGDGVRTKHNNQSVLSKSEPLADGPFVKEPELVSKGISVGSEVSGAMDAASKAIERTTLSKKSYNSNARSSSSVSCEKPTQLPNGCNGHSDLSKSGACKAGPSLVDVHLSSGNKDGSLRFVSSEVHPSASASTRTSFEVNDGVSTSKIYKTRISSTAAGSRLAPKEQLPVEIKSVERDNGSSGPTIFPSPTATLSEVGGLKPSALKLADQLSEPKIGRDNDMGLFSYDLFVKIYISNKVEMRPFGLVNCGNSCYANAVLQCLVFTPPLTAYFAQGLHSKTCVHKGWCFSCEFEKLISKAKEGRSPLSPIGILSQLRNIGSQLSNGREEDAHEFLRYSIDTMQSICLKEASANSLTSLEETTLVGLTFGGYLHSKIRCLKCNYKSEKQEKMMDLAVEIGGDIAKLEDALKRFTSSEILDGDNKYLCNRCKSKERAKKKLTILEAPNVLTIALKRFQSGKFGKLNKSIRFPEILNLAPYMNETSDNSPIYGLYGVIVHVDVMNTTFSGHYVCYVKNVQNKWFKVDDSMVTSVDLEMVLAKGAYMLLYSRCSPRAPRLIRNSIIPPDAKGRSNPSRINAKSPTLRPRSNVANTNPQGNRDSLSSYDSFYLKFHRLQKIIEEDSSSDSFSFGSNNSDEGSWSTDSAKDSASTDELSDYIFGGCNNAWISSSGSDASSSSSSPMFSTYSPTSPLDSCVSISSQPRWSKMEPVDSTVRDDDGRDRPPKIGSSRPAGLGGKDPFLHTDSIRSSRKLVSSSSCRETDSVKVGSVNPCIDVKSGLSFRRSTSERTA